MVSFRLLELLINIDDRWQGFSFKKKSLASQDYLRTFHYLISILDTKLKKNILVFYYTL